MKIEWLRCFNEIAQTNSISKAAQNLYISQPALSKIIKHLESETGEILLLRSPFGVRLTQQGEILWRYAQEILRLYDGYQQEKSACRLPDNAFAGVLELAISPLILQSHYQIIVKRLGQRFPQIKLRLVEADLDTGEQLILQDPYTLGLLLYDRDVPLQLDSRIFVEEIYAVEVVMCMSADSPYATQKTIDFAEIPLERQIATSFSKRNSAFPAGDYNCYTTNLDIIIQKLLSSQDVCVSLPRFIAEHKLISPHIICLPVTNHAMSSVYFLGNRLALEQHVYAPTFIRTLQAELLACLLS